MDSRNPMSKKLLWPILSLVAFLVAPGFALIAPPEATCPHEHYWLEAECGTIMAPGLLQQDGAASEGGFVTTAPGSGNYIDQVAGPRIATYDFELQYHCHTYYYLWARVKYNTSLQNSFWVAFDNSSSFPWRFNDQLTGQWHWERLGSISGLSPGSHQFFLKLREEQTQVDKFVFTSDAQFVPSGLGDPAANSCMNPLPEDAKECDLCDPTINLGDLVVLNDPYFPNDPYKGWPAIVVGQEAGYYALLTHRQLPSPAPYAKGQGASGQGFPYDWQNYRVVLNNIDPYRHTIIVPEHSLEQYVDCRGLLSFRWDAQRGVFTGAFRSDEGFSGDIEIMPGVIPSGISAGDNDNMRLQGMLHSSENTVFYPLVSSTLRPFARESEVVIREILNNPFPQANTYGLGVIECWNLDRPANSKIISLTNLVGATPPILGPGEGSFSPPQPPSDSERLTCMTVHLRPSVFDFTETGAFISYVCSDCGVIQRIDTGQTRYENGRLSDSDHALVFPDTGECYVLPRGLQFGSWSDLEGTRYRLSGFREYANPANSGYAQVRIGGVPHSRLGFLAAPTALLPCTGTHPGPGGPTQYTLRVSSDEGGHVTPSEGTFTLDEHAPVTLTAVADAGYAFDGWTITGIAEGTVKPINATISFTMNGNYSFHAKFKRVQVGYTLRVSSDAGGRVTPAEGTFTYNQGTVVTLRAEADAGYTFDGWTITGLPAGTLNPISPTLTFQMNGNYTFHAKFKRIQVTYTLKVSSDTGGRVTPAEGTFTHSQGTWVTLRAEADAGYAFDGWTLTGLPAGTLNPISPTLTFQMNGNYTFHAKFKRIQVTYTLKVSSDTGGRVTPAEGTFTHNQGTWVTLQAVADAGYTFNGWTITGLPAGTVNPASPTVTFTMNGNYTFHAKFKRIQTPTAYTLTVSSGTGGYVVPAEGSFNFQPGTYVALLALANPGYTFAGWTTTGVPAGTINPADAMVFFPMNGNYTFHATFKAVAQNRPNLTDGGVAYRDFHPQAVFRGETINVSFRLKNTGAATAADGNGLIKIAYFASTDATITTADHPLGDEFTWSLGADQYRDLTVPLKVPNSMAGGSYFVGWIIDPGNAIQESNETDNVAYKDFKKLIVY